MKTPVIAPTPFLNKCSATEFARSRTVALGTTAFFARYLTTLTFSIFHLSELLTKRVALGFY